MAKQNIRPLGNHVLIQRSSAADVSKGGIIIPEKGKEKPREGKVVAVGNGKMLEDGKRHQLQLKEGDRVLFNSYAGTEVKLQGEDWLLMEESDVLAIIK